MEALRAGADAYLLKDGPGRHLLDAISFVRDGGVYVSPMLRGAGLFTKAGKSHPAGPAGWAQSAGNGSLLLSGERATCQRYCRSAGDQPQNGGYLPRKPDAQTERSRSGRAGEICDRAQPYDDISAAVGSTRFALTRRCSCWYRSNELIRFSTADLRSYRRARARRRTLSAGCAMRTRCSRCRSLLAVKNSIRLFLEIKELPYAWSGYM